MSSLPRSNAFTNQRRAGMFTSDTNKLLLLLLLIGKPTNVFFMDECDYSY
jgi:hypothetical protein